MDQQLTVAISTTLLILPVARLHKYLNQQHTQTLKRPFRPSLPCRQRYRRQRNGVDEAELEFLLRNTSTPLLLTVIPTNILHAALVDETISATMNMNVYDSEDGAYDKALRRRKDAPLEA